MSSVRILRPSSFLDFFRVPVKCDDANGPSKEKFILFICLTPIHQKVVVRSKLDDGEPGKQFCHCTGSRTAAIVDSPPFSPFRYRTLPGRIVCQMFRHSIFLTLRVGLNKLRNGHINP